jgi:hypothetical protein
LPRQDAQGQRPFVKVPAKRYAKAIPPERYAKAIPSERYTKKTPDKCYTKKIPAERYAKAIPAKRYASAVGFSKHSTGIKPVTPNRGRNEMASLLQRAFSGYSGDCVRLWRFADIRFDFGHVRL